MKLEKKHFFLKLIPPRPNFSQDMSDEERSIMLRHTAYLAESMKKGIILLYGPVMDPTGTYGLGIAEVDTEEEVKILTVNDPATLFCKYEIYPMRAITPDQ
jgi:uncharacterized protein